MTLIKKKTNCVTNGPSNIPLLCKLVLTYTVDGRDHMKYSWHDKDQQGELKHDKHAAEGKESLILPSYPLQPPSG